MGSKSLLFNNVLVDGGGSGGNIGVYVEVPVTGDTAGNLVNPYVIWENIGEITDGTYAFMECTFSGTSTYGIYLKLDDETTEQAYGFMASSLSTSKTYYAELFGEGGYLRARLREDSETGTILKTASNKYNGFNKFTMTKMQRIKSLKIKKIKMKK